MDFNQDCADWVHDVVSKMDDGEARMFTLLLADDLYTRDVEGNARSIARVTKALQDEETDELAHYFLGQLEAGEDPERMVGEAAAIALARVEIAKAETKPWSANKNPWDFQSRDNNGRFGSMSGQYRANKKVIRAQANLSIAEQKAALRDNRRGYTGALGQTLEGDRRQFTGDVRDFQDRWQQRSSGESSTSDAFRRMEAGGKLVRSVGFQSQNPSLALAGQAAAYAGQFGPEAEKVVGPAMRRTAYRYRGTERTPDKELKTLQRDQMSQLNRNEGRHSSTALSGEEKMHATEAAAIKYLGGYSKEVPGDKGNTRTEYVPGRVASASRANLQRQSGRVTPSEGILIDADGDIVAQAVGFAEDHYLPFNLKNLGSLKGGSYVRTRESGGLTSEDVYTGLMSGARSMTVVSNSGIFTVDFDDELRGGRRYNDKAKQMVGRYAQTLDAIKSEQVANPARAMSAAEKARIRVEVEDELTSSGLRLNDNEIDEIYRERLTELASKPRIKPEVLEEIEARASREPNERDQRIMRRQLTDLAMDQAQGQNYQLDGEGYGAAMDALKEQFPYYIADVRHVTKQNAPKEPFARYNSGTDKGYVKPRYLRPEAARAGYFDESIEGRGKTSADRTLYQNYANRSRQSENASEPQASPQPQARSGAVSDRVKQAEANAKQRAYDEEDKLDLEADLNSASSYHRQNVNAGLGNELKMQTSPRLIEYARADSVDAREALLDDPVFRREAAREYEAFLVNGVSDKLRGNLSQAQRIRKQNRDRPRWDENKVKSSTPPDKPQSLTDEAKTEALRNTAVRGLLDEFPDDESLKAESKKAREARDNAADYGRPTAQFDASIKNIELARAARDVKMVPKTEGPQQSQSTEVASQPKPVARDRQDAIAAARNRAMESARHMVNGSLDADQFEQDLKDLMPDLGDTEEDRRNEIAMLKIFIDRERNA